MAKGMKHGAGGGASLNFKVVGNPQPENPKENTIWVDTGVPITSWYFGADEPNVCNIQPIAPSDQHCLVSPKKLSDGDIVNFTIPSDVGVVFEAIRIYDPVTDKQYCVRSQAGTALTAWTAGAKVGVRISNVRHQIGAWVGHGTAFLMTWDSYYHEEGTVWISTGTSSHAEFNALKKNSITVYPLTAKQYVDGAWVGVPANIFQNGEWVYWWQGELFKDGNQYTSVTGGWHARDLKMTGATAKGAAPVIRKGGNSVTVSQETYAAGGVYEIVNDIDLSKYSTLTFKVSANSYGLKGLAVYDRSITTLGTSTNAPLANAIASATLSNGHTGTVTINVSGINKAVCIGIAVYCNVSGSWPTVTMTEAILS